MNDGKLIDALFTQGWFVWDDFLTQDEVIELKACIPADWSQAGIGRNDEYMTKKAIRSDKIQWLSSDMGQPVTDFLQRMDEIRMEVNRHLFLGLFEYEAHFAKYEQGDFYQKHLDCFRGQENRKLTTVFYLNNDWQPEHGGRIKMYDLDDNELATLDPKAGRLVVFLSELFPHEVLPVTQQRFSIAGWFRTNGVSGNQLDIAR
ncbi:SM-20 protein [Photobacterium kishitanii]|uniref:SM-20 protein n=1 Tax=Photobacterium kishitanii TaxID=318456 RepID=A0A2T3KIK6_9GAMM|nr:2OG-Fe(II) oxygenase [Photobacterium kishitanii]KJG10240.1 SM-20 protein [Photobacterium kishitanii]KJG59454.1 SM-20 protein [Photobacterium kishitanii]KJG62442.1 SM-20 protein [Photobacterium kishitanii]KJG67595.1 SM-20 protein [Photobacterium kishitanii]KJG70263.1 SM-20 protein [Photobacterium kishitanii]